MPEGDKFSFHRSGHLDGVTQLDAAITDFRYTRHTHDDYSIAVTREGYQSFYCAGRYYRVPRGGVIQINPDELHDGFASDASGFCYSIVYLPRERVRDTMAGLGLSARQALRFRETVIGDVALRRRSLSLMQAIQAPGCEAIDVEERFAGLIEALCQRNGQAPENDRPGSRRDALVSRAKAYLHDHLEEPVSLEGLATELNVSKYHLIRLFKRQTGSTPYRYLLDSRVNAARRALEAQDDIARVIERFGFYDLSHLNRRFKEVYGATPRTFRRQLMAPLL